MKRKYILAILFITIIVAFCGTASAADTSPTTVHDQVTTSSVQDNPTVETQSPTATSTQNNLQNTQSDNNPTTANDQVTSNNTTTSSNTQNNLQNTQSDNNPTTANDQATSSTNTSSTQNTPLASTTSSSSTSGNMASDPAIITFDDGYESAYTIAYPIMKQYGIVGTVYIITDLIGQPGYLTLAELTELHNAGWTVAGHTVDHTDLQGLSQAQIANKIQLAIDWLNANGFSDGAYHLAYPYGLYDNNVLLVCAQLGLKTARTTNFGTILPNGVVDYLGKVDYYQLPTKSFDRTTVRNDWQTSLSISQADGSTTIFLLHDIVASNPTVLETVTTATFTQFITDLVQSGIRTLNINQWYNEMTSTTAPVANFTATPVSGTAPLNVAFTSQSTGSITSYAWDFNNDGTVDSTTQNPTYTYNTAGTYTVKLTVTGSAGSNSLTRTNYITVNNAAPVANFTATPVSGTAPLNVAFTSQSTGSITSYAWDFNNDGTVDSTAQNPTYTYNTAGTYTVKLTVTGPGGSNSLTKTNYITVNSPVPVANFIATPTTGTSPLNVAFTSQSTGTITSYAWDFNNDGTVDSTAQNPTYTYSTPGTYTVKLTVTGPNGSNSLTRTNYITVNSVASPVANFIATPTTGTAPLNVQFTSQSTGTITSYAWDFNNDGVVDSTAQTPAYTYNTAGTYTIKLTVTGPGGSNSLTKTNYITVNPAPVGFVPQMVITFDDGYESVYTIAYPIMKQYGIVGTCYVVTSWIGTPGYLTLPELTELHNAGWTIADHSYSHQELPTLTTAQMTTEIQSAIDWLNNNGFSDGAYHFAIPYGYYNDAVIQLCSQLGIKTARTTDWATISTNPGDINFLELPCVILRSDTSSPSEWQSWFDYSRGTETNTIVLIHDIQPSPDGVYETITTSTFTQFIQYLAQSGFKTLTINQWYNEMTSTGAPVANFIANPTSGKPPLSVQFTDQSTGTITSYAWDFNNDGVVDSTAQNPAYTYNSAGTYTVKLTVTGSGGSNSLTRTNYITVYSVPVANFVANTTSGNAPLAVKFTDQSTGSAPLTYQWDFNNDGVIDSTTQSPSYTYSTPGTYTVKLTVTGPGGSNSLTRTSYIQVNYASPVANFTATPTNGVQPLNVAFTDSSTGTITSYAWDFNNDGTVDSTAQNPTNTYNTAGTYTVKLTVTGPGGSNSLTRTNYITVNNVASPVASFTATPVSGTTPLNVAFTDSSTGTITSYAWDFNNDGTVDSTAQNPTNTYNTAGTYTVKLTVTGPGGSNSLTRTNYITVNNVASPVASFTATPVSGTTPLNVAFTDSSTGTITSYAWDFNNDGTVDSTAQNPTNTYNTAGTYTVKLTVTGPGGSNSLTRTNYITVNNVASPVASFTATPVSGTTPLNVAFTDSSTGTITSYAWDFNNDGTVDSTAQNPTNTYNTAGTYTVKLTVTGPGGSNSLTRTNYVTVTQALPDLTITNFQTPTSARRGVSYPVNVTVTNSGSGNAGSFLVYLYDGSRRVGSVTVSSLQAGQSTTVTINWVPTSTGTRNLRARADATNLVTESNENNNYSAYNRVRVT